MWGIEGVAHKGVLGGCNNSVSSTISIIRPISVHSSFVLDDTPFTLP